MRLSFNISVFVLCTFLFAECVLTQTCYQDLSNLENGSYPKSNLIHDATGKGDYGFFFPFDGYFDPGKWTVCDSRVDADQGPAQYCYISLNNPTNYSLTVGACVPASCSASDLNNSTYQAVIARQLNLPKDFIAGFTADCKAASYDIPWGTWVFVCVYIILISLLIIGTLLEAQIEYNILPFLPLGQKNANDDEYDKLLSINDDVQVKPSAKETKLEDKHPSMIIKLLLSFSFLYNYGRLTAPSPPGSFDSLNGVRVICTMFVVLGHTFYFIWDSVAIMNFQTVAETVQLFRFQIVVAGFYAVDTFFWLSGFLVAYYFLKELKAKGINVKMMVMFYFHRIYRLTPTLLMGLFFFYLITPYWSSGPYWRFYQAFVNSHCSDSWWFTALYIQNFIDPKKLCMGWSWYLADDMQYYILSPLILIVYWKNKAAGWAICIFGVFLCMATTLGICMSNDLQEFQGFEFGAELGNYIPPGGKYGRLIYLPFYTRYSPYLIGFMCAFLLLERGATFRITPPIRTIIYITSSCIILVLSFITWSDSNYGWTPWMNYVWITICRPIWSVGLGSLLIVCMVGYGGVFSSIMSRPFWVPYARLSYGAYIFHLVNLGSIYAGYKSGVTYTFGVGLYFFFGHLIIAFLLSFGNFFLVEKPLMNIESLFLRRPRQKTK